MVRFRALGLAFAAALTLARGSTAGAQTMQDALNELFVFSGGDNPLFLVGSGGVPNTEVHGNHFIPSESQTNGTLLDFFNNAIAGNIASFPLSSTVSSETFRFVDGVPVPSSNSFGPIYAERAQTIGKGRLNAAVNYSRIRFSRVRGVDLNDVELTFVHENSDFPNCDEIFGGDCGLEGVPQFENDLIDLALDLDIDAELFALSATFGLTDWLDVSVAVPVIGLDLDGTSVATIEPTTTGDVLHFFGGTPDNPVLEASSQVSRGTSGIGDVATRLKARLVGGEPWQFGVLGEIRAPTGREEDFLGRGEIEARGIMIVSGTFGDFSPHANAGYRLIGGDVSQDAVELIAGFDHRLADWATLAVDVLGSFKVGDETLTFPEPAHFDAPHQRSVRLTNIPSRRDDVVDGSLGFKFQTGSGIVVVTNVLVPLNEGGLRATPIPTLGLEYSP